MEWRRRWFLAQALSAGAAIYTLETPAANSTERENSSTPWTARVFKHPEHSTAPPAVVSAVKIHPQGKEVISAGDDHHLTVWNLARGTATHTLRGHSDWVRSLAISASGDLLASAGNDGRILLWDTAAWKQTGELAKLPHAIAAIDLHPDGTRLAAAGWSDKIRVFDLTSGKLMHELVAHDADTRAVVFSPDGQLLAAAGRSGKIRLWNLSDQSVLADITAHSRRVCSLLFSSDSSALLSAGEDGVVRLTPLSPGFEPFALPRVACRIQALAFCGENQLAVGGSDNRIHLWNLKTRESLGVLRQHTGTITALDCLGGTLVSGGYDTALRVWSPQVQVVEGDPPRDRVSTRPTFRLK